MATGISPHRIHRGASDRGTALEIKKLEHQIAILRSQIGAVTVNSGNIAPGSVTSGSIATGAITATTIAAGAITAYVETVDSISLTTSGATSKVLLDYTGITAYDAGGVQQGKWSAVDGSLTVTKGTITGAVIQTGGSAVGSAGSSKVMMDSTGLKAFDNLGNNTVFIDTTGKLSLTSGSILLQSSAAGVGVSQTGARVTLDSTGIKGFNSSNTQQFSLDASSGLITATGVLVAQSGSNIPATVITGQIVASQITSGTITATQIASNTITSAQIAANTITAGQIASGTITSTQIAANTITASNIASGTITGSLIAAGTITGSNLVAGTITSTQIAGSTITASNIAAGTITGTQLAATAIDAMTITGATFRTSAANPRVVMDSTGLTSYDSTGVINIKVDATTGKITALNGIGAGNLLRNSSFDDPTGAMNHWTGDPWVADTTQLHGLSTNSLKFVADGTHHMSLDTRDLTAERLPCKPGETYTGSVWVYWNGTAALTSLQTYVCFHNAGGTLTQFQNSYTIQPNVWTRMTCTATAPSDAVTVSVYAVYVSTPPASGSGTLWADEAQLELGNFATSYAPRTDEILPATVTGGQIASGTVTGGNIASQTITAANIVSNTITATQIAANTIGAGQIVSGSITATQIASATITSANIAASTITASNIAASTITASQIAANTITAGQIAANTITASQIAANTITASQIAANTITASQIASGTITATQISASAGITATMLSVTSLAAISANLGSIVSGTITGAVIQTSATVTSTGGVIIDSSGLRGYNSSGAQTLNFTPSTATITGSTIQTGASDPRTIMDSSGLRIAAGGGASSPGGIYELRWTKGSAGAMVAHLYAFEDTAAGYDKLLIQAQQTVSPYISQLELDANDSTGSTQASVLLDMNSGVSVQSNNGGYSATVLSKSGQSNFVYTPQGWGSGGTRQMQIDWGNAAVTATAGTAFSFNHNLGAKPAFVTAFCYGGQNVYMYSTGQTTTNVTFKASGALSSTYVCWMVAQG